MSSADKPTYLRVLAPRGFDGRIDRANRTIQEFSVITAGEARGHGGWIDATFLRQVAKAGNALEKGLKSRFTHPGLSGDGLGTTLGRAKNFRPTEDGSRILADLHVFEAASKSPKGDLAEYVFSIPFLLVSGVTASAIAARGRPLAAAVPAANHVYRAGNRPGASTHRGASGCPAGTRFRPG